MNPSRRRDEFRQASGPGFAAATQPAGFRMTVTGGSGHRTTKTGSRQPAYCRIWSNFGFGHQAADCAGPKFSNVPKAEARDRRRATAPKRMRCSAAGSQFTLRGRKPSSPLLALCQQRGPLSGVKRLFKRSGCRSPRQTAANVCCSTGRSGNLDPDQTFTSENAAPLSCRSMFKLSWRSRMLSDKIKALPSTLG